MVSAMGGFLGEMWTGGGKVVEGEGNCSFMSLGGCGVGRDGLWCVRGRAVMMEVGV